MQAGEAAEVGVILIGVLASNQTLDKHFKTKVRRYARIYCDRVCVCLLRFSFTACEKLRSEKGETTAYQK